MKLLGKANVGKPLPISQESTKVFGSYSFIYSSYKCYEVDTQLNIR